MNELSLFSGVGGGLIGTKALGFNHIGYVEYDNYCQKVLAQRIKDGMLDNAPIYGDIRTFIDSGRCELYRGVTDIITAGFPCQPFSVAGKRKAGDDARNMWPATMEVIKKVCPAFCLIENVPGLLSATVDDSAGRSIHYYGEILRDLAEGGFDAKWCVLGADDVGAPHRRKRVWIYAADPRGKRRERNEQEAFQRESVLPWGENLRSIEDIKNRPDVPEPLFRRMDDGMAKVLEQTRYKDK